MFEYRMRYLWKGRSAVFHFKEALRTLYSESGNVDLYAVGDSPSLSPSHTHTHTLSFLMHISHLGSGMLSQIITGGLSLASLVTALCGGAEAEAAAEAARVSGRSEEHTSELQSR